jgi:hypothetical protein
MAVPASGELKLWDTLWNQELAGSKGNNSLHSASIYAGFSTPDALGDFYGWSDVETPSVTTLSAQSVAATSAVLRGCVTDTGNENVTSGFYFGNSNTSTSNPKYTLPGTRGTGIYCCSKTGLSAQTRYYVWAYACNSAGECIATNKCTISTPAPPFTVTTGNWYNANRSEVNSNAVDGTKTTTAVQYYINPYTSGAGTIWNCNTTGDTIPVFNNRAVADNADNRFCANMSLNGFPGYAGVNISLGACRAEGYCWNKNIGNPAYSNFPGRLSGTGGVFSVGQRSCEVVDFDVQCTNYPTPGPSKVLAAQLNFRCRPYNAISDIRFKTNISYL